MSRLEGKKGDAIVNDAVNRQLRAFQALIREEGVGISR
jgi:hypothetical protein